MKEYFSFADPILHVDWGEDGIDEYYTPEYIAAHPEQTQVYVIRDSTGEIIAGAKVAVLTSDDKSRLGLSQERFKNDTGALLEYAAVKEEHRNKKLQADLSEKRIAWARERGASYICSEAEINNPISIYTKIRDGFVLVSIQQSDPGEGTVLPYFVELKFIDEERGGGEDKELPEWREEVVTDDSFEELNTLFDAGWVGVDIKGADEALENLTVPWTLVLERRQVPVQSA